MTLGLTPPLRSKFEAHAIDNSALEHAPAFDLPFNPEVKIRGYSAINQTNCQVITEDFLPGTEFWWTFTHDEFQYALGGDGSRGLSAAAPLGSRAYAHQDRRRLYLPGRGTHARYGAGQHTV